MPVSKIRCVRIQEAGEPDVLVLGEGTLRIPGPFEVRVRVAAAGLNRADCLQRRGRYPAPAGVAADIPGLEFAGEVEAVGVEVRNLAVGERVMGIVAGAAMASHVLLHADECVRVPENLSLEEAAAIPEVFMTAFDALVVQAKMRAGERVLLHAVGSGIGTAALQIVSALGAISIGTSRTASKLQRATSLGLHHGVSTASGTFAEEVRKLGGADVILDTIGAKYLEENLRVLNTGARVVVIGLLGGLKGELHLGRLLQKRASIHGSVLRSRPLHEKIALARAFEAQLMPLFERGQLHPVVDAVLPMADIAEAHRRMEAGDTFGKLVMRW